MGYPDAWVRYLVYFHADRDYFECHEELEQYWKQYPASEFSTTWHGLIQVAVGLYHHRRGNIAGAKKMIAKAIENLDQERLGRLGIDGGRFLQSLIQRKHELDSAASPIYEDLDIPIADPSLMKLCEENARERFENWGKPSLMQDSLVHKHKLRDRSDVIETRRNELLRRQIAKKETI